MQICNSIKFANVGHVFVMQKTMQPCKAVVCSYTGIHFIKLNKEQLELMDISYETEQFINRVIEYDTEQYLAVSWDNNKYIFIDNVQERIIRILAHPESSVASMRCWGLQKVAEFSMAKCPFVLARDNLGFVLINVKTHSAF